MVRTWCVGLSLLVVAVCSTPAWAGDDAETRAAVSQLLQDMDYQQLYQDSLAATVRELPAALAEQLRLQFGQERLTAAQQAVLERELPGTAERAVQLMLRQFDEAIPYAVIEGVMVDLMVQHFTREEIHEMSAFYRTPTGRKALTMTPAIMAESLRVFMPKIQAGMQQSLPLVEQEFKALAAKLKAAR